MSWRPAASHDVLKARARMLQGIRAFFMAREVREVETPVFSQAGNTDPSITPVAATINGNPGFLQTSPEFPMKRLLAAGSGDIYQICKAFRDSESGRYHNPEFTLLEWYRLGFDHHRLMDEVIQLIREVGGSEASQLQVETYAYHALFLRSLGLDVLSASDAVLEALAQARGVHPGCPLARDAWLDLLLSHCITSRFPADQLTVIVDYPATQAALARLNADGVTAARFEIYWGGVELANGYHELLDGDEQRQRLQQEARKRAEHHLPAIRQDEHFLQAVEAGLPDCAGVALGLDRLLMKLIGADHIDEVIAFPFARA
jgi:lysyl-tRNA synthetase class 2